MKRNRLVGSFKNFRVKVTDQFSKQLQIHVKYPDNMVARIIAAKFREGNKGFNLGMREPHFPMINN